MSCQVSLPKLVTLVCEPNNTLAFVPLCKAATQMALKARSLGQVPYLSSFHFNRKYKGGAACGEVNIKSVCGHGVLELGAG